MTTFSRFRTIIAASNPHRFQGNGPSSAKLLIPERSDRTVRVYYAPFDHLNPEARLVLVGITPGREQMNKALKACCEQLQLGRPDREALSAAKRAASFGGSMRDTLVELLDRYGFQHRLGVKSCKALWDEGNHDAHFTSALRNPVFRLEGNSEKNYTGGSPALSSYSGFKETLKDLRHELMSIDKALIVPLGSKVAKVIQELVTAGSLPLSRVLNHGGKVAELPHPSGANRESQNLVLAKELPDAQDYAHEMLRKFMAEKREEGKTVTAEQQQAYIAKRYCYWNRGLHSRLALDALSG